MILAGTTADKMRDIYTRPHRNSIYEPATIHDIPYEVLRESFIYLLESDLASPSLACRAFRAVAMDLMNYRKSFIGRQENIQSFISGLHLRSIVGLEIATIKYLTIDLEFIGKEYIPIIARFTSISLSHLSLWFEYRGDKSSECYEALGVFLIQCDGIRNLRLEYFDFGGDPTAISQTVKDGFVRLMQLDLIDCRGDIRMFVENTPIPNLEFIRYASSREAEEEDEIIAAFALNYHTLVNVKLIVNFDSSASLLKIVECCRDLMRLVFADDGGGLILERSDMLAIASLPRLKYLGIRCRLEDDALSALLRCKGMKELRIPSLTDPSILAAIGRNLVRLNLWIPSKEVVDGIVDHCPNLQYLELDGVNEGLVGTIKNGLTKLAKLKMNGKSVRLGTDWEGYSERES
jgi:hypothetical protein